jgi:peroxiredoxin (alkyl hydroperoxide reductase subunit C)
MKIPLAADLTHGISKNYGVLLEDVGHTLRYVISNDAALRWRLPWSLITTLSCIPCSGLFIIDEAGVLRQVTMNDLPVGRSVDETLRLVKAFKV